MKMIMLLPSSSSCSPSITKRRKIDIITSQQQQQQKKFVSATAIGLLLVILINNLILVNAFTRTTTTTTTSRGIADTTKAICPRITSIVLEQQKQQQQHERNCRRCKKHQPQQQRTHHLNAFSSSHRSSSTRRYSIFYDDFEDFYQQDTTTNDSSSNQINENENSNDNGNDDADLFASLRARQTEILDETKRIQKEESFEREEDLLEKERLNHNWNEANCLSTVRVTLDDWVRRLSIDLYPLVVAGSSRGNLYLADLEEGDVMDCLENVHTSSGIAELIHTTDNSNKSKFPNKLAKCLKALYDGHDGNGPLAIAVKKDLIVSSGREGGIHACTIVGKEVEVPTGTRGGTTKQTKLKLQREGTFRGLEKEKETSSPPLITSLGFDDRGTLWAGGYDGILRGYHHEEYDVDDRPLMLRQKRPDYVINVGSPILDMKIQEEFGVIVVTTETDGVFLYSLSSSSSSSSSGNDENEKEEKRRPLLHVDPFSGRSYVTRDGDGTVVSSGQKQFCRTAMIVRNDNSTTTTMADATADDDDYSSSSSKIINEITDKDIGKLTQSLIVGGSFGHLYQFTIRLYGDTTTTAIANPTTVKMVSAESMQKVRPKHMGPIVNLASPSPGLFVTASHDGTMRVWDCGTASSGSSALDDDASITVAVDEVLSLMEDDDDEEEEVDDDDEDEDIAAATATATTIKETKKDDNDEKGLKTKENKKDSINRRFNNLPPRPNVLYALSGYKVWLGSVFANENKLVSDGADNTIIVHSFDEDEEAILRSQQEDDEDDKYGEDGDDPFGALS